MRDIAPRSITNNYVVTHDGQASRKLEREAVRSQQDLHYASSNGTSSGPSDADHTPIVNGTQEQSGKPMFVRPDPCNIRAVVKTTT